jgi:hypothetical protein
MAKTSKFDSIEKAKEYILAHPDESKMEQAVATGFGDRTIARARAELVYEGKLAPSRKKVAPAKDAPSPPASVAPEAEPAGPPAPESTAPGPAPTGGLLDNLAMQQLANLIDTAASEEDDTTVHKRLLKQCLLFAFDTRLHPDTRMSASQMWSKLRDQSKARELGPGKPKTRADAVVRLRDMNAAVGVSIWFEAGIAAFGVPTLIQFLTDLQKEPADATEVDEAAPPRPSEEAPSAS